MDKLCRYVDRELEEYENKVANGGKLSRTEIEDGKNLAKFKMALLTNDRMETEGYSGDWDGIAYEGGRMSRRNRDGISGARKRDSMGRYSRDSFIDELHAVMEKAPDEKHRRAIKRMIEDLEAE